MFSSLKNGTKIMMMGSVEQEIKDVSEVPTDLPTVINDFDEVIIRNYFFQNSLYSCMYVPMRLCN